MARRGKRFGSSSPALAAAPAAQRAAVFSGNLSKNTAGLQGNFRLARYDGAIIWRYPMRKLFFAPNSGLKTGAIPGLIAGLVWGLISGAVLVCPAGAGGTQAPASEGGERKLVVSCYDSMNYRNFLEEAVRLFRERRPDIQVELRTFSAMPEIRSADSGNTRTSVVRAENDPRGRSDYISRVSAALMSGEGADIYAMDILPLHLYVEAGRLENLETLMAVDPLWDGEACRGNILQAARYRGGLWFLPLDYSFDYYAFDSSLLPANGNFGPGKSLTLEGLIGLARPLYSGGARLFNLYDHTPLSLGGMFGKLLEEQYSYFVNLGERRANFNDGVFAALLNSVRDYAESGLIPQRAAGPLMPGGETDRYFFKLNGSFALVNQYGRLAGRRMSIRNMESGGGIEEDDEIAGVRAHRDGDVPFSFSQAYAINANSRNKEDAWEFLKFLTEEEIQGSPALSPTTLPLNNRARRAKAEAVFSGAFMGRAEALNESQRELLEAYRTTVEELSDQINGYVVRDTLIDDMIALEADYFFSRLKTAEEAAAVLHNKVNLYLHEQDY
jgi:ABC-type glycerol-3-phosphate transport system substrate-binding protein